MKCTCKVSCRRKVATASTALFLLDVACKASEMEVMEEHGGVRLKRLFALVVSGADTGNVHNIAMTGTICGGHLLF